MSEQSETQSKKRKSVKGYASNVFKDSAVLSGILSTKSIVRKVFKALIFLIFTVGFLYQCIMFLSYLLTYPTVMTIEIIKPDEYMRPAYTFCSNQKIMKSKYCEKYPDRCISTDEDFCERNPDYCEKFNITVKEEYLMSEIAYEDIIELRHGLEDFMQIDRKYENVETSLHFRDIWEDLSEYSSCFSLNSHVDSSEEPEMIKRAIFSESFLGEKESFVFTPKEDIFDPHIVPGILFAMHSPFDAINPFIKGHFLKPGKKYKILISMMEEELLPPPYKTDCMDYHQIWINNGKSGPRSQEMCRQKCMTDFFSLCYNCSYLFLSFPSKSSELCFDFKGSHQMLYENCTEILKNMPNCLTACKEECFKMKYVPEVRELQLSRKAINSSYFKNLDWIYVDIDFEETEVMLYKYRPQYMEIEAFSYIGGFIGIWLGISLVQVTDFFESIFLIVRYLCKRNKRPTPENI